MWRVVKVAGHRGRGVEGVGREGRGWNVVERAKVADLGEEGRRVGEQQAAAVVDKLSCDMPTKHRRSSRWCR